MSKTDQLTPQQFHADCICLNTQRAARAVARRYDAAFRSVGLTSGQFSILAALNQDSAITIRRLAEILGLERTTLTRNLAPLEASGLIRSESDGGDKRLRGVMLTPAGIAKLKIAIPLWATAQAQSHSALADIGWTPTRKALDRLATE